MKPPKHLLISAGILAGLVGAAFLLSLLVEKPDTFEVRYQNESFRLPLEDTNYTEAQAGRIESMIISQLPPSRFESYTELIAFHTYMEVPGYGSSTGGFGDQTSRGLFTFISVQIPKKNKHRVFVYRSEHPENPYIHIDDFIFEGEYPPQIFFEIVNDQLNYRHDGSNRIVRARPIEEVEMKINSNRA